jgi:hypothetical protein
MNNRTEPVGAAMRVTAGIGTTVLIAIASWFCAPAIGDEWMAGPATRVIGFAGYRWFVKDSAGVAVGPGPNVFDAANVEIRQNQLHLSIRRRHDRWTSGEVVSTASFGYGRYRFEIGSGNADLDPSVVLGLFTWSDDPAFSHREIDIEISRWGSPSNQNAQCVVQPYQRPDAIIRFDIPKGLAHPTYSFTWMPESVTCEATDAAPQAQFRFEHRFTTGIPTPGGDHARINLWRLPGQSSGLERPQEVALQEFQFTPLTKLGQ